MIFPYTNLPNEAMPRPLADIQVAGLSTKSLVDSGAINTIFPLWVADLANIDLSGAASRTLGIGGVSIEAVFRTVQLQAVGLTWEGEVGFSNQWAQNWGLLGHDAFFRYFSVTFRAADLEFELEPNSA